MSNNKDNRPVRVTGQERQHPAIRLLARACIELARQRRAKVVATDKDNGRNDGRAPAGEADGRG